MKDNDMVPEEKQEQADNEKVIGLPEYFFSQTIKDLNDITVLKVILYAFYRLDSSRSPFIKKEDLTSEGVKLLGISSIAFSTAVEEAMKLNILLYYHDVNTDKDYYFINNKSNEKVIESFTKKESSPEDYEANLNLERKTGNIYTLYEQNIGLITPMLSEELKAAAELYPAEWIEDAFKEAVMLNKRSWRYIARILERWAREGKQGGTYRQGNKKGESDKYIKGKYGHLVQR